jgi:hypothetical protein
MVRKKAFSYNIEKIITDVDFDADEIGRYTLVLQINDTSLFIGVFKENSCLAFEAYRSEGNEKPEENIHSIEMLSKEHRFLGIKHWKKIVVILNTASFVMVPKEYFSQEDANLYLQHNAPVSVSENYLHFSSHLSDSVFCVFPVKKELSELLESLYPNTSISYTHTLAVFTDLAAADSQSNRDTLNVLVRDNNMTITAAEQNNLFFANCFKFSVNEDFVYFTLLAAQNCGMDTEKMTVKLYGEIAQDAPVSELLKKYIRNVSFGENPADIALRDAWFAAEPQKHFYSDFFAHVLSVK